MKTKPIQVYIDSGDHLEFQVIALKRGKKMSDLIREFIKKTIKEECQDARINQDSN